MVADALHVLEHALLLVGDGEPTDVLAFGRTAPAARIVPAAGVDAGGLEAAAQQLAHDVVGEGFHAAVGVVDDEPLAGTQQLVGNDQRADGVIAGAAAGIADDVGVALREPGILGRIEAGVHAGEDGEVSARRHGQAAFIAEIGRIALVGSQDFIHDGTHACLLVHAAMTGSAGPSRIRTAASIGLPGEVARQVENSSIQYRKRTSGRINGRAGRCGKPCIPVWICCNSYCLP